MNPVLVIHKLIDMMLGYDRFFYKTSWERVGEPNLLDLTRSVDGKHIDLVPLVAILSHSPRHLQEHITRWKKIGNYNGTAVPKINATLYRSQLFFWRIAIIFKKIIHFTSNFRGVHLSYNFKWMFRISYVFETRILKMR